MPMPVINVPIYPNVPFVLGVPAILRSVGFPPLPPQPAIQIADSAAVAAAAQSFKWGIYDQSGSQVLVPDSMVTFGFMNEFRISDYPVEDGGFESYNKVATPFDVRVMMTKSGNTTERQNFLDKLEEIISVITLFDVVTPEKTYLNANIVRYDYDRTARNGVNLLTVYIFLREVRILVSPDSATGSAVHVTPLVNTKAPNGADALSVGDVQAQLLSSVPDLTLLQRLAQGMRPW